MLPKCRSILTSLLASIRQKIRWGQGHWFVALSNTGKLFASVLTGRISVGEFLSLLTYMYSITTYIAAAVQLVVSIVAGRSIAYFKKMLGESVRIVRLMPNTPALVGAGMTAGCCSAS